MRNVRCGECGKVYDFDVDDFCPKCGAFNQPRRQTQVNASGSVVRMPEDTVRREGINERNHAGSFVHAEFHEENRQRRGTNLERGTRAAIKIPAKPVEVFKTLSKTRETPAKKDIRIVIAIAFIAFLLSFISSLLG